MKLGVAIASDNALPSAFVVMRGLEKSIKLAHEFGYDGVELALAQARLSAERELLRGAVSELTVTEERVSESGGEIAVTLTLRLILAANY